MACGLIDESDVEQLREAGLVVEAVPAPQPGPKPTS
jgi:hypothetical protein